MRILSLTKQVKRGAENKFFRVVFFIGLYAFFSLANSSCAQTKNTAQKSPAETKPQAANQPPVTGIDDAEIKQLLKPGMRNIAGKLTFSPFRSILSKK